MGRAAFRAVAQVLLTMPGPEEMFILVHVPGEAHRRDCDIELNNGSVVHGATVGKLLFRQSMNHSLQASVDNVQMGE